MGGVYGYCTQSEDITFPFHSVLGLALFFFGSTYALSYEVHRFWWKAKFENKGKLHTTYLAALSIHPNYFGDLFTYAGWALVSGTVFALQVPFWLPMLFMEFVIPNSDAYLARRYPEQFPAYANSVGTLIPFIHGDAALRVLGWFAFVTAL